MSSSFQSDALRDAKPLGYRYLAERFQLRALPHHLETYVGSGAARKEFHYERRTVVVLPKYRDVGDNWVDHLEFALRHEGLHLGLLATLFTTAPTADLVRHLREKPGGRYLRIAWFCYEELTGEKLPIEDLKVGNYVNLLDPKLYFTGPTRKIQRQRVNLNLLGDFGFCSMVRRIPALVAYEDESLAEKVRDRIERYPVQVFLRALNYLYRKETKSSFEIENEAADQQRAARFVNLLHQVDSNDYLTKRALVALQKEIVDPRFANDGYRDEIHEQIWVGSTVGYEELIHYIGPKPEDLPRLMASYLAMARMLLNDPSVPTVIAAATTAYAFVFLHPFSDGNGRIHRFLIHYTLAQRQFSPPKVILPVSAVMLARAADYDRSLESFSVPLLPLVRYELDQDHRMTVVNDTADLYRWIDYTFICEMLFSFLKQTVDEELPKGLDYLMSYDEARKAIREIVDLPDRLADLLIVVIVNNQGSLSRSKRKSTFRQLTDEEVSRLETVVREAFKIALAS